MLDNSGSLVVEYKYDAWGKVMLTEGSMANTLGRRNHVMYRSYTYDTETDEYYLNGRYYSPVKDRFDNMDVVISNEISKSSVFCYSFNSPVILSDSNGQLPSRTDVKIHMYAPREHYSIEAFGVIFSFETNSMIKALNPIEHEAEYVIVFDDVPKDIALAGVNRIFELCNRKPNISDIRDDEDLYRYFDKNGWIGGNGSVSKGNEYVRNYRPCVWMVIEALDAMDLTDTLYAMCGTIISAEYTSLLKEGKSFDKLKSVKKHYTAREYVNRYEIKSGVHHICVFDK